MGSQLSTLSLSLVGLFQEEFRLGALWCSYIELELGGALSGVQIRASLMQFTLRLSSVISVGEEFRLGALWCSYFELELGGVFPGVFPVRGHLMHLS